MTANSFVSEILFNAITAHSRTHKKHVEALKGGVITNNALNALIAYTRRSKEHAKAIVQAWPDEELQLTQEQNTKGITWLKQLDRTPAGAIRNASPLGNYERAILADFSHFTVAMIYDAGNANREIFVPVYRCYSKGGQYFDYYVLGGDAHLI